MFECKILRQAQAFTAIASPLRVLARDHECRFEMHSPECARSVPDVSALLSEQGRDFFDLFPGSQVQAVTVSQQGECVTLVVTSSSSAAYANALARMCVFVECMQNHHSCAQAVRTAIRDVPV